MTLVQHVRAYLKALDALNDSNERGVDDSGKRPTDSLREWTNLSCAYDEALAALREVVK